MVPFIQHSEVIKFENWRTAYWLSGVREEKDRGCSGGRWVVIKGQIEGASWC